VVVRGLLEETKESVVDNARQQRVLEESYLVDEFELVVRLLGAVPSHGDVLENSGEVRLGYGVEELGVLRCGIVFDQDYFFVAIILVVRGRAHHRRFVSGVRVHVRLVGARGSLSA